MWGFYRRDDWGLGNGSVGPPVELEAGLYVPFRGRVAGLWGLWQGGVGTVGEGGAGVGGEDDHKGRPYQRGGGPHSAPPPWVPAFAGMTRWGAGMMRGRGDVVEERGKGMGSRLRGSKRGLGPVSPAATPITLTSILSQDGRGGKRGGEHPHPNLPPSRETFA